MPTYDFECKSCEDKFSVMISIKDRDKVTCPKCNSNRVRQILSVVGVQIKKDDSGGCGSSCPSGGFG